MSEATKEQTVFWLGRRIRELELSCTPDSDSAMARAGMSYASRRKAYEHAEKEAESNCVELAAMRTALRIVDEHFKQASPSEGEGT